MQGRCGDEGSVLSWGVGGDVIDAAFVAAADHVEDGPGKACEVLRFELAGGNRFLQDGDEGGVAGAENVVGLAAVLLLAANGDDQPVEVLVVDPELEAGGDGDAELLADAVGGGEALGDELLELADGLLEGGGVDILLGAEIEVEGAFGDFGGGGDVVDRGVGETLLAKDLDGRGEDFATA